MSGTARASIVAVIAAFVPQVMSQERPQADKPPASAQPAATRPAETRPAARPPGQIEIIESLLRDRERSTVVPPRQSEVIVKNELAASQPAEGEGGLALLPDGTTLIERPGRLVWEEGDPKFVFLSDGEQPQLHTMGILPNRLLEALEREARTGTSEFVISAEVTRYKDQNYLLLRKILRRVSHGNLTP